jgi:RNA-directed DNA polymerase
VSPTTGTTAAVAYADDLVVMCATEQDANQALELLTALLGDLGLAPKTAKTRIVHLREGGEGLDFLGFHHRTVRGNTPRSRHLVFLARWPSRKAMQHARDCIRAITARSRLRVDPEELVGDLNAFLRGWTGYFRYGNSAHAFLHLHDYAVQRLALWVAKRRKRPRAYGWARVVHLSPNHMGLLTLDGRVVAPRPHRDWRETPKAAGERRR